MALRRSALTGLQQISAPFVGRGTGPVCLTCGRTVDEEKLVEGYPGQTTFAKVLVRHHGAEELRTFDMGSVEWDHEDLRRHMWSAQWFDPGSYADAGIGKSGGKLRDHEDEEPKRLVTSGAAPKAST